MEGKTNTEENAPEAGWEGQTPLGTPRFHSLVLTACAPTRPSEAAPVLRQDPSAVLLQVGTSSPPLVPIHLGLGQRPRDSHSAAQR